jgi:hypothetical protein
MTKPWDFLLICLMLTSCSEQPDTQSSTLESATPIEPQKTNNPLAKQQAYLSESKALQAIIDKDSVQKKNALENIN